MEEGPALTYTYNFYWNKIEGEEQQAHQQQHDDDRTSLHKPVLLHHTNFFVRPVDKMIMIG